MKGNMGARYFDSVLCFGDSDWWYHNRGHADMQFMRRFARRVPTLYVNSLGVRLPQRGEGRMFARKIARKALSLLRYYRDGREGFPVLSPVFVPFESGLRRRAMAAFLRAQLALVLRASGMRRPLVWIACPTASEVLSGFGNAPVVYQLSDCYAALGGGASSRIESLQDSIATRADLVTCASDKLQALAIEKYGHGEYVDHGVDFEMFAEAQHAATPPELAGRPRPIIGFFGNIDGNTVDRELLANVIKLRPQLTFALVGPMASEFGALADNANVVVIPRQSYGDIPRYGAAFDVCLMPWLQNEWIAHCNPVKLKEYLALGKPIVTTPFAELHRYKNLYYEANDAHTFAAAIDRALKEDDPQKQRERRAAAARHTWDMKFETVLGLLAKRNIYVDGDVATSPQRDRAGALAGAR